MKVLITISLLSLFGIITSIAQDSTNKALAIKKIVQKDYYINNNGEKGDVKSSKTETYNEKGLLIEQQKFNKSGENTGKTTYEYNHDGNRVKLSSYKKDGELRYWYEFKYDGNGNQIEWLHYVAGGELLRKYVYTYDKNGNRTEEQKFNAENELQNKTVYVYEAGMPVRLDQFHPSGALTEQCFLTEDEDGNTVEKKVLLPNGTERYIKSYEYSRKDKHGNWLTKKYTRNEKLVTITERVIEYWK